MPTWLTTHEQVFSSLTGKGDRWGVQNQIDDLFYRLRTVVDADHIIVLKGGRVEEEGTHESLLRLRGLYYEMWMAQADTIGQEEVANVTQAIEETKDTK